MLSKILPSHSQPKLSFTLNPDTGLPDGFRLHEHRASNKMIEEFMLLANMAVARKIYTTFPDVAILRRHPDPKMDMLDKIVEQLGFLGIQIDGRYSIIYFSHVLFNLKNRHQTHFLRTFLQHFIKF